MHVFVGGLVHFMDVSTKNSQTKNVGMLKNGFPLTHFLNLAYSDSAVDCVMHARPTGGATIFTAISDTYKFKDYTSVICNDRPTSTTSATDLIH